MKFKTKYFVFVFVCLFLFCELPLQFYLFLILVLGPGASDCSALKVFWYSTNLIQLSPNFNWRLWVFGGAQKRFI